MYEYEIRNKESGEIDLIYGYTYKDALARCDLNPSEWEKLFEVYVD